MNNNEKQNSESLPSRRKFVWHIGALAALAAVGTAMKIPLSALKKPKQEKPQNKTITMLTQDGRLVQVNEASIVSCKRKANKKELLNWIKK